MFAATTGSSSLVHRQMTAVAPIDDPRAFCEVLRDWMTRNEMTYRAAAARLDWARGSIGNAIAGGPVRQERALRALMTMVDEGRA